MDGWHLKREVPIAMIVALLMQTGSIVWFVSKLDSRISALEEKTLTQTGYDRRQWDELNALKTTTATNDKRITALEAQQSHIRSQVDKLVDRLLR